MGSCSRIFKKILSIFKWMGVPLIFMYIFSAHVEQAELPPAVTFTFQEHVAYYNYPFEEHSVTTSDGYILSLYRIPGTGPAVLLTHGLSNSANCFILNQCGPSPAFLLSDNGYDVWLGNHRGSHLSRGHISMNSSSDEYWDWSFPDLFIYDLPAFIDFVKNYTKQDKIALFGHSQGGAVILWGFAHDPDYYHSHTSLGIIIGTSAGVIKTESYYLQIITSSYLHSFFNLIGINVYSEWTDDTFAAKFIKTWPRLSSFIAKDLFDVELHKANPEDMAIYLHRVRGGTSVKNLVFWKQMQEKNDQRPFLFDYGEEENLAKYGTKEPPRVDFANIKTKLAVFNGKYDRAIPLESSRILRDSINKEALVFYNDQYDQDHAGFLVSCNMTYFNDVLRVLKENINVRV